MFEKAAAALKSRLLQQLEQEAKDTLDAKASGKGDQHSVTATPSGVTLTLEARTKVRYLGRVTKTGKRVMPSPSFRRAVREIPKIAITGKRRQHRKAT